MDALVAQIAVAVVPEPVPVVVETIVRERMLGRRPEPKIVIHAGGYGFDGRAADGVAPLEAQPARHVDIAQEAVVASCCTASRSADGGTALAALLHHAIVLARRRHNLLGLQTYCASTAFRRRRPCRPGRPRWSAACASDWAWRSRSRRWICLPAAFWRSV